MDKEMEKEKNIMKILKVNIYIIGKEKEKNIAKEI